MDDLIKKRNKLLEDMIALKNEVEIARNAILASEKLETSTLVSMHSQDEDTRNINPELSRMLTGTNITNILLRPVDGSIEPLLQYEIDANIQSLQFNVTCIVNKTSDVDLDVDKIEIKALTIRLENPVQQNEMQTALKYFSTHAPHIGFVMTCLNEYNKLYNERQIFIETILQMYKKFFTVTLDNDTGHYNLKCCGKHSGLEFFRIIWRIAWNGKILWLSDTFNAEISNEDQQFVDDVTALFKILCNKKNFLTKEKIRQIFNNIMIAVKDADTRIKYL